MLSIRRGLEQNTIQAESVSIEDIGSKRSFLLAVTGFFSIFRE